MELPSTTPARGRPRRDAGVRVLVLELAAAGLLPGVAAAALAFISAGRAGAAEEPWLAVLASGTLLLCVLGSAGVLLLGRRIGAAVNALRAAADRLARGEPLDSQPPLHLLEADEAVASLRRAYRRMCSCTHERDEALLRSQQLAHAAQHDPLTQLLNRAALERQLAERLMVCRAESRPLTLFFVDIDDFKPVNDRHGHLVGDELLRAFAARLRSGIREGDCAARVGGDEFVVLFDGLSPVEAMPIAETLVERLSQPYAVRQLGLRVGACVGVAAYPRHGHTAQALLKAADEAMYRAKAAGKNDYRVSGFTSF
jgi:diguanylate cyclase (GGDEF)-like protein